MMNLNPGYPPTFFQRCDKYASLSVHYTKLLKRSDRNHFYGFSSENIRISSNFHHSSFTGMLHQIIKNISVLYII